MGSIILHPKISSAEDFVRETFCTLRESRRIAFANFPNTHTIHGWYIYHKNQPNVGRYTIHGWYGLGFSFPLVWHNLVLWKFARWSFQWKTAFNLQWERGAWDYLILDRACHLWSYRWCRSAKARFSKKSLLHFICLWPYCASIHWFLCSLGGRRSLEAWISSWLAGR